MKFIGDRSGRWEKAERGDLRDWRKSSDRHILVLHRWVWKSQQSTMNTATITGFVVSLWCVCALRGLEREMWRSEGMFMIKRLS